jgi:hypothetical protein
MQNGSSLMWSPVAKGAGSSHADVPELATSAFPFRLPVFRGSLKTADCSQISAKFWARRSPARPEGNYGNASPWCETKHTPVPARQPFVVAFISEGCPPACGAAPEYGPPCGCPFPFISIPVEPGIIMSVGPMLGAVGVVLSVTTDGMTN